MLIAFGTVRAQLPFWVNNNMWVKGWVAVPGLQKLTFKPDTMTGYYHGRLVRIPTSLFTGGGCDTTCNKDSIYVMRGKYPNLKNKWLKRHDTLFVDTTGNNFIYRLYHAYCNGCTPDTGWYVANDTLWTDSAGGNCYNGISHDTLFLCGDTIILTKNGLWVEAGNNIFLYNASRWVGIGTSTPQFPLDVAVNTFFRKAVHIEGGDGDVNNSGVVNAVDALLMERYSAGTLPWWNGLFRGDISGNTVVGKIDALLCLAIFTHTMTLIQAQQFGRFADGNLSSALLDSTWAIFRSLVIQNNGAYLDIANGLGYPFVVWNDVVGTDSSFVIKNNGDAEFGGTIIAPKLGTTTGYTYVIVQDIATGKLMLGTSAGGGTWGAITGTLSAQSDLRAALDSLVCIADSIGNARGNYVTNKKMVDADLLKLNIASPQFTGVLTEDTTHVETITGGAVAVDWNNGNTQAITLNANITSFAMIHPPGNGAFHLYLNHANNTTDYAITWPTSVQWPNATNTAPTTYGVLANGRFLISFSWYAGYYHASPAPGQYVK